MNDDFLPDDVLSGEAEKPKQDDEQKPKPETQESRPGWFSSRLIALRDWATWDKLILIGAAILLLHFLVYNLDPMTIDFWGWTVTVPKILGLIIVFLVGMMAGIRWQQGWLAGRGVIEALLKRDEKGDEEK